MSYNENNNVYNINKKDDISDVYTLKTNVLKFISHFTTFGIDIEECFLYGNCYYFALILYNRFKSEHYPCYIVYDEVYNHFACQIGDNVYDIRGVVEDSTKKYNWAKWAKYIAEEPSNAYRVIRDCIMF